MSAAFERVAIVGVGLMGGSLARALQGLEKPPEVRATSLDAGDLAEAHAAGAIAGALTNEWLATSDLIVYAAPPTASIEALRAHASLNTTALITDLCSVKKPLLDAALELGFIDRYVGSHPLAGDHRSGFAASRADLFRNATVFVTPASCNDPSHAATQISSLWEQIGAHTRYIDAAAHDELMAWVSHLPQLASSALAATIATSGFPARELGPGGRDATRLAQSSAVMWADLLTINAKHLEPGLRTLRLQLEILEKAIVEGNHGELVALLERAHGWRAES